MRSSSPQKHAIFLMLLCATLWSTAGIFIKLVPWNPLVICGWRSLIASSCVLIYMRATECRFVLSRSSVIGGFLMTITFFLFVSANKMTTAANAIVLQFSAPAFLLVLSALLLRQRFSRADLLTVLVTTAGISLFFIDSLSFGNPTGDVVAVISGFTLACMFFVTGNTDPKNRMSGILIGHLLTAAIGIPLSFVYETPLSTQAVLAIVGLGIIQLGIPYVLYGVAVRDCPPLMCALLSAIEPLLNPLWVFLYSGERPGGFSLVGGVIVITTITYWCIHKERTSARSSV